MWEIAGFLSARRLPFSAPLEGFSETGPDPAGPGSALTHERLHNVRSPRRVRMKLIGIDGVKLGHWVIATFDGPDPKPPVVES